MKILIAALMTLFCLSSCGMPPQSTAGVKVYDDPAKQYPTVGSHVPHVDTVSFSIR